MPVPVAWGDAPASVAILLVEDDEVIRRSVTMALERYGYRVTSTGEGLTGLELFREGRPDLLLDVMLPGLDGIGLCHQIRETSMDPILMTSARGDALDVVSGLEAGVDDYVVKPVDTAVLMARIRSLLCRAAFAPAAPHRSPTEPGGGGARPEDPVRPGGRAPLVFGDLTIDTAGLEASEGGEAELGVGGDDQPGPQVGGRGVADLGDRPAEGLLEQPEGVFKIESAEERLPAQVDILAVHAGV